MTVTQPTTIYLVRHGQTEWNALGILQGQKDAPLTPKGISQAHQIASLFHNTHIDVIYSSDLGRAHSTAKLIAEPHNLEVHPSNLLRERNFGQYQGQLAQEIIATLKDKIHHAKSLPTTERMDYELAPDVETDRDLVDRLVQFLSEQVPNHLGQTMLVVTHEGVMRAFLIHLGFGTHDELSRNSISNVGYIQLTAQNGQYQVVNTHGVTKQIDNTVDRL